MRRQAFSNRTSISSNHLPSRSICSLRAIFSEAFVVFLGVMMPVPLLAQTFDDVPPDYWAFSFIETLADSGITSGCGGSHYCPTDPVTRAQMAVFLERGINGSDFSPPAATGNAFLDVGAGDFAAAFIEQLSLDGITAGCGNNNYCPDSTVTRDQMAVFLLRSVHGAGYSPPPATGIFDDVPLSYWAVHWIEQLAAEGITTGCGGSNYCPEAQVTRDQMAVFLVRAFELDAIDYNFPGGTIADLRAVSPTLSFNNLTFSGELSIPSSESSVVISVANFTLNPIDNAAGIVVDYPACKPFGNPPNVTINASGDVTLNDSINLRGKGGVSIAEGATCNSPFGIRGGNLEINAQSITVNGRIDTSGGNGATESSIIGGTLFRFGYDGKDAGSITLNAASSLALTANANLDAAGGSGATGSHGSNGVDGADGRIAWTGNPVTAVEIDSLNALTYNAQRIPYGPSTIDGVVGLSDDSQFRDSSTSGWCQVNYTGGFTDFIEDIYRIDLGGANNRSMTISATSTSDIDIFVFDGCPGNIIGEGNGATGIESITTPLLQPGGYFFGVSYADDAAARVNASYEVTVGQ
jgi:hypothetical protein